MNPIKGLLDLFGFSDPEPAPAAGSVCGYRLVRSRRKTVSIQVSRGSVIVRAPMRLPLSDIESFVRSKQDWISQTLRKAASTPSAADEFDIRDGGSFPFLGGRMQIRCGAIRTVRKVGVLYLALPPNAPEEDIAGAIAAWVQPQARELIGQRVARYAPCMPGSLQSWALSGARSRWGCCTSRQTIRYSWRLAFFSLECIDYVVVHELAHLTQMNHGPEFWAIVKGQLPAYEKALSRLKDVSLRDLPV